MIIIIGSYITFSVNEIFLEDQWEDFERETKPTIENWNIDKVSEKPIGSHLSFVLGIASMKIFDNYRVVPFIASIALLILVYFFTVEVTKKRFAGIVALVVVL